MRLVTLLSLQMAPSSKVCPLLLEKLHRPIWSEQMLKKLLPLQLLLLTRLLLTRLLLTRLRLTRLLLTRLLLTRLRLTRLLLTKLRLIRLLLTRLRLIRLLLIRLQLNRLLLKVLPRQTLSQFQWVRLAFLWTRVMEVHQWSSRQCLL